MNYILAMVKCLSFICRPLPIVCFLRGGKCVKWELQKKNHYGLAAICCHVTYQRLTFHRLAHRLTFHPLTLQHDVSTLDVLPLVASTLDISLLDIPLDVSPVDVSTLDVSTLDVSPLDLSPLSSTEKREEFFQAVFGLLHYRELIRSKNGGHP